MAIELVFALLICLVIARRFFELRLANRNTQVLISKGAIELGKNHYRLMLLMHSLSFVSMLIEAYIRGVRWEAHAGWWVCVFFLAQLGRAWVMNTMKARWTTRVLVIPGETLISTGPFRYLSHPNYLIVAMELFALPTIFGLYWTAVVFTISNAVLILGVRIPTENKALRWARKPSIRESFT